MSLFSLRSSASSSHSFIFPRAYLWCRACRHPALAALLARRPRSVARRRLRLVLSAPRRMGGCRVRFVVLRRPAVLAFGVPLAGLLAVPRVYALSALGGAPAGLPGG
jgi:hypothetical protein